MALSTGQNAAPDTSAEPSSWQEIYTEIISAGGTPEQAAVGSALASGVESSIGGGYGQPQSQEMSGGVGPAQGLFQFEPSTWIGAGGGVYGPIAGDATWQQQVQVFVNYTKGDNFGAWGPDLVANSGDPNSASNPSYGYSGAPQAGSRVGNVLQSEGIDLTSFSIPGGIGAGGFGLPVAPLQGGQSAATGATSDVISGASDVWKLSSKFYDVLTSAIKNWEKILYVGMGIGLIVIGILFLFHKQVGTVVKEATGAGKEAGEAAAAGAAA
jgi:Transglycosylase-like domain